MRAIYELVSWPAIPEPGEEPRLKATDLLERLSEASAEGRVVRAVFLEVDLFGHLSLRAGAEPVQEPLVLDPSAWDHPEGVPEPLRIEDDEPEGYADRLWWAYGLFLSNVAQTEACDYLERWSVFERSLRFAALLRRNRDGGAPIRFEWDRTPDSTALALVEQLPAEARADEVWRHLERGRFAWIEDASVWFDFSVDEVASYATRLLVAERYWRVTRGERPRS